MNLGASLPVHDWQFWVVTALAVVAAVAVARAVLPAGLLPRRLRRATGQRRATLTVGGRAPESKAKPGP